MSRVIRVNTTGVPATLTDLKSTITTTSFRGDANSTYVDSVLGLDTNDGSVLFPFLTVQAAINSSPVGTAKNIIITKSSNAPFTLRANDVNLTFTFSPKSVYTGAISLVPSNNNIFFQSVDSSALVTATINDNSSGAIYWNCNLTNSVYNKLGGSTELIPAGTLEFQNDSILNGVALSVTRNTTVRTNGIGQMGQFTQSNGVVTLSHEGSVLCPTLNSNVQSSTMTVDGLPLTVNGIVFTIKDLGTPVLFIQNDNIVLIKNGSNKSLICPIAVAEVHLVEGTTIQGDGTYGIIDFTNSGATVKCKISVGFELNPSTSIMPSITSYANTSKYLKADYTATNYVGAANDSLPTHLSGIDTKVLAILKSLQKNQAISIALSS